MIPGSAVYHVVEAMAPLYTAAVLGYASVRWLKAFSDEQCAGINHFVALYAAPVLIFHSCCSRSPRGPAGPASAAAAEAGKPAASPLKWVITNFSVATLPNTVIIGMPLLDGMYGSVSGGLMKQIIVMQFCIWYNVVIFLYEFMAARDSSAKIRPLMPAAAENGGSIHDERSQNQVVVNIEVAEVAAPPPTAPDSTSKEPPPPAAKELSTDGIPAAAPAPAALPLAITSFVYAEEYKVHADIMSTGKKDTQHVDDH
nr:unnamed protein product [Digitaria exilis]